MMQNSLVGRQAPNFKFEAVYDDDFLEASLSDYSGKTVVLFFYPHDFVQCSMDQLLAFDRRVPTLEGLEARLLAISYDSKYTHLSWYQRERAAGGLGRVEFALVSDHTHEVGRLYGVFNPDTCVDHRAVVIIDKNNIVRYHAVFSDCHTVDVENVVQLIEQTVRNSA